MKLALFDLDNTLLAGDSDYLWGRYLVDQGLVDAETYEEQNRAFYADYQAGQLDIHAFAAFSFGQMARFSADELASWRDDYLRRCIAPIIAPQTPALIEKHRAQGHELLIVTATNAFLTAPIADHLGVSSLLATVPERINGRFTGRIEGIPCFREGKIERLQAWLSERPPVTESWGYSDSINDAPLLDWVDHPHAVDPCPALHALAGERGWPVMSLR